jgi:serine/threonine-protein kinase
MKLGERVGPFDIEKQVGCGAMGTVYRARYRKTGQRVAIKVLAPGAADNSTALARFEREAEVLKQLNHRNIVRFYIASHHDGAPYYAMEFVEGEPLNEILERRGRLPWEEVVELGKQICAALQHAHDQGIIHRDLKPSNLMLMRDGTCKLTDFGIAKDLDVTQLTAANCTVGTAAYMSPEQCKGERGLTNKSDLYSLGVVLYELLTGQKPFKAETTMEMFLAHVKGKVERPSRQVLDIPVWLDTLVCQLLEKKPEHRPYDALVVTQALEQVAEKVAAQRSAGVDLAEARVGDRSVKRVRRDDTDREAERTLRDVLGKGRGRRQKPAFYERGWLQAIGILAVLTGLGWIFYQAFLRTPTPEELFQQAQKRMESTDSEERGKARDGPVAQYLRYYPDRTDEQALQVRQWADAVDLARKEHALYARRNVMAADGEAERTARSALVAEENGDFVRTRENWESLVRYKQEADVKEHAWGLLAEKRLHDLETAEHFEREIPERIKEARSHGDVFAPKPEPERLAAEGFRFADLEDAPAALSRWQDLKARYEKDREQHAWFLLAAKKVQQLKKKGPSLPDEDKEAQERRQRIRSLLAGAANTAPQAPLAARALYQEIATLYANYSDPEVAQLAATAAERSKQIPP